MRDLVDQINDCEYIFALQIEECGDNQLRVVVQEAHALGPERTLTVGGTQLQHLRRVQPAEDSLAFELVWETYVAYSVRNESFVSRDDVEQFDGRLYRLYSKSHFLEYVSKATFATREYPGPFKHIELVCQNHIIDVVSTAPPEIRHLRTGPSHSSRPMS